MKIKMVYCWAILPVLLISCNTSRYIYSPATQNVPVLVKKGDSKLSASYSTDLSDPPFADNSTESVPEKNNGFDLQGAVALTDNFALQASYFNRTERDNSNGYYSGDAVVNYKRNLAEIGIGYFKSLNARDKVFFQLFGGAGKGKFSLTDRGTHTDSVSTNYTRYHQADITKFYLQPAMIFRPRPGFALSISTRLSIIKYGNIKTDYTDSELQDYELDNLSRGTYAFWEPAFTNSFGFKKLPGLRFEYQLGFSLSLNERPIHYHPFNFSLGMAFDFPKLFAGQPATD